jgi:hypothetical protein
MRPPFLGESLETAFQDSIFGRYAARSAEDCALWTQFGKGSRKPRDSFVNPNGAFVRNWETACTSVHLRKLGTLQLTMLERFPKLAKARARSPNVRSLSEMTRRAGVLGV